MANETSQAAEGTPESAPRLTGEGPDSKPAIWNPGDPTDGKDKYEFASGYPLICRIEIFIEAMYLVGLMLLAAYLVAWYVAGSFPLVALGNRGDDLPKALHQLVAFPIAGLMGGTMFGLKWQYRVAARGWWHKDRRVWRICSPWHSAARGMMIGIAIDGGLLGVSFSRDATNASSTLLSIGFVTGYFADSALAKLQDIASVIFSTKSDPSK